ncbi:hypothetical protein FH972_011458 [Carpinus fangiana]|uniref:Uncharacterized protein n=1 Tax=Carpinus fangiana TaxID=176857 RepID=A0A660KUH0_9ROSI|nr:hypothetical protein FH972_011458 [Carpinus fangiana]
MGQENRGQKAWARSNSSTGPKPSCHPHDEKTDRESNVTGRAQPSFQFHQTRRFLIGQTYFLPVVTHDQ